MPLGPAESAHLLDHFFAPNDCPWSLGAFLLRPQPSHSSLTTVEVPTIPIVDANRGSTKIAFLSEVIKTLGEAGMYSMIQIIAIVIFSVSFLVPWMWIWGHIVGIVLFLWASVAARRDKRLKNIERELQKNKHRITSQQLIQFSNNTASTGERKRWKID